jgi:hypothetical protein
MTWPFWTRALGSETVILTFTAEQALALAAELEDLRDVGHYRARVDELHYRLTSDAAYLALRADVSPTGSGDHR